MGRHTLTNRDIKAYSRYLLDGEHSPGTMEKYLRDITRFSCWLDGRAVTKIIYTRRAMPPLPSMPCSPPLIV